MSDFVVVFFTERNKKDCKSFAEILLLEILILLSNSLETTQQFSLKVHKTGRPLKIKSPKCRLKQLQTHQQK